MTEKDQQGQKWYGSGSTPKETAPEVVSEPTSKQEKAAAKKEYKSRDSNDWTGMLVIKANDGDKDAAATLDRMKAKGQKF